MNSPKLFEIHITNIKRAVGKAPEAIKAPKQKEEENLIMSHQNFQNMIDTAIK